MKLDLQLFASGSISLGTSGILTGQVNWSSTSNGTVANSSNVYAELYVRKTNSYSTTGTFTGGINIGGVLSSLSKYATVSNNWVLVGSFSRVVPHNADGSCSIYIGGWIHGPSGTSLSNNGTSNDVLVTLDKIPRQATITGADNFNDIENPSIGYSNPAGNSVTSLQACISLTGAKDDIAYRDIPKTGTSYIFNLTDDERELLRKATPNSNNLNVIFYVRTIISGATYYSTITRTMTIVNANPTFSTFNFEDVNTTTLTLTGNSQNIIKGYSNIKVTIPNVNKATANKYATMKSYSFNEQKTDYSDTEDVSITANKVNSGTLNVLAIDSRGNVTTVTKSANNVVDYTPIKIAYLSMQREGGVSGNVNMRFEGTWWNGNFGKVANSIKNVTYTIYNNATDKTSTGTTKIVPTIDKDKYSFNGLVAGDNETNKEFDPSTSYIITLTVNDELTSYMLIFVLGSGIPAISISKNGVGIFCKYDNSIGGYLQVNGQKIA